MSWYVVATIDIHDAKEYEAYSATFDFESFQSDYGGEVVVVSDEPHVIEGEWQGRLVVLKFPSKSEPSGGTRATSTATSARFAMRIPRRTSPCTPASTRCRCPRSRAVCGAVAMTANHTSPAALQEAPVSDVDLWVDENLSRPVRHVPRSARPRTRVDLSDSTCGRCRETRRCARCSATGSGSPRRRAPR